ncbi:MAG: hypothetical protein LBL18_06600 [Bacteroidales bacterium]|jgi:hypothetical protein|nr:hypothetical protein [Bacteroidales bacterium]
MKSIVMKLWMGCLSVLLLSLTLQAQSDTEKAKLRFSGFSGGMALHTGYLYAGKPVFRTLAGVATVGEKQHGMPVGIGGVVKFHFGRHFRVGSEGYSSTLIYGKTKSRWSLSWGGLLADCQWQVKRWTWFAGGTAGFGAVRHLVLLDANSSDLQIEQQSVYHKYNVIILVPFVGVEYALTGTVHLCLKLDYAFNVSNRQPDFAEGLRVYFGFSFYHKSN